MTGADRASDRGPQPARHEDPLSLTATIVATGPRAAPLARPVWGMPGPVWSMVAWSTVCALLLVASILMPLTRGPGFPTVTTISAVTLALCALAGLVLRERMPTWGLHLIVAVWIGLTCWLIVPSAPIEISVLLFGLVICAVYVGYWLPLPQVVAFAVLWCLGTLAAIVWTGFIQELAITWLTAAVISCFVAVLLSTLTRFLRLQAIRDPLTGVLNRAGLEAAVAALDADQRASLSPLTVVIIDLDGFKEVNDRDGHVAGDAVLVEVAHALRSGTRKGDILARMGGDEFILLLPRTDGQAAAAIIGRAAEGLATGWSFGSATWDPSETYDAVVARADARMYEDKRRA